MTEVRGARVARIGLRFALYVTLLVGLLLFFRVVLPTPSMQHTHLGLGVLTSALAVVAIPSAPGAYRGLRQLARLFPLLPLLIGMGLFFGYLPWSWVIVHAALGVLTLAIIEASLIQSGRSDYAASASQPVSGQA